MGLLGADARIDWAHIVAASYGTYVVLVEAVFAAAHGHNHRVLRHGE